MCKCLKEFMPSDLSCKHYIDCLFTFISIVVNCME